MRDPIRLRAERLGKRTHEKRVLVCTACVKPEDFVFGGVHTDRKCGRCGVEPNWQGRGGRFVAVGGWDTVRLVLVHDHYQRLRSMLQNRVDRVVVDVLDDSRYRMATE
jgi:hypothetical protein